MALRTNQTVRQKTLLLSARNQITIPGELIPEGTNQFMCRKLKDGSLLLIPCTAIPTHQAYFWTKRWQEGEREAEEDIRTGRVTEYDSAEALMANLDFETKRPLPSKRQGRR